MTSEKNKSSEDDAKEAEKNIGDLSDKMSKLTTDAYVVKNDTNDPDKNKNAAKGTLLNDRSFVCLVFF